MCPNCGHHLRITAEDYVELLIDSGTFEELDDGLRAADPLRFRDLKGYPDRIAAAEAKGKTRGPAQRCRATWTAFRWSLAVMDFSFIGGSMGSVVGEKIARAGRTALERGRPFIVVSASGGARMQEGIYSLMQMAKTSAVLARLHEAGLPFVSVLTNPTTGGRDGVLRHARRRQPGRARARSSASPVPGSSRRPSSRSCPKGFQRSEFLLEHGMVDRVVDRRELRDTLALLLRHMMGTPDPGLRDGRKPRTTEAAET